MRQSSRHRKWIKQLRLMMRSKKSWSTPKPNIYGNRDCRSGFRRAGNPLIWRAMMAERVLTLRELNRATLARQFLLERASLAPLGTIERLVAMQGQVSNAPYIGLWARLRDFQRADLTRLLEQRQVVRASSLRGTLHLTSAEDYLQIHPILQPALSRNLHLFARQTPGFD